MTGLLGMDYATWSPTTFSKNRDRLLENGCGPCSWAGATVERRGDAAADNQLTVLRLSPSLTGANRVQFVGP